MHADEHLDGKSGTNKIQGDSSEEKEMNPNKSAAKPKKEPVDMSTKRLEDGPWKRAVRMMSNQIKSDNLHTKATDMLCG